MNSEKTIHMNKVNEISDENPFRSSKKVQSLPISYELHVSVTNRKNDDVEHLVRLRIVEETALVNLGNKLSAIIPYL